MLVAGQYPLSASSAFAGMRIGYPPPPFSARSCSSLAMAESIFKYSAIWVTFPSASSYDSPCARGPATARWDAPTVRQAGSAEAPANRSRRFTPGDRDRARDCRAVMRAENMKRRRPRPRGRVRRTRGHHGGALSGAPTTGPATSRQLLLSRNHGGGAVCSRSGVRDGGSTAGNSARSGQTALRTPACPPPRWLLRRAQRREGGSADGWPCKPPTDVAALHRESDFRESCGANRRLLQSAVPTRTGRVSPAVPGSSS